ncbi:MAG: DEAD/DEAH box helicase [Phycisphaerales bacterium]|nr:DEAD/DEAH box helicase [Planctomycetota bacterium]MBL6998013.1 DEAD/DEAH box helicase [Phycisphaerales bacterium]
MTTPKIDLEIFDTKQTFADIGLNENLQKAVDKAGFKHPTIIQSKLIPLAITGIDVLGQSRTGSGKTAAFGLPALSILKEEDAYGALILVPTRELAIQVATELEELGQFTNLKAVPIYGGQKINTQITKLEKRPQIIVGTPGRVMDLHQRGHLPYDRIKIAILDEVDRMLDIGFRDDIRKILGGLKQKHQTIFVSATISDEINRLSKKYTNNAKLLDVTSSSGSLTVAQVSQEYLPVEPWDKQRLLFHLLTHEEAAMTLIFCKTKATVDKLTKFLTKKDIDAAAIHGDLQQSKRNSVMQQLRDGKLSVLIASDLASRGIDVENITHVINYDVPEDPEIYVHRIGRTARAGRGGIAWMFVTPEQGQLLTQIETLTNVEVPIKEYPDFVPGPEPKRVREERQKEEERIEKSREGKSRTKVDIPSEQEGKDDSSFPGGVVPKGLPNKRMGGRVRTRRR